MTLKDIFESFAYKTTVTARVFSFTDDGQPSFKDTIITFGNVDAFVNYSINCLVATGKDELLVELA